MCQDKNEVISYYRYIIERHSTKHGLDWRIGLDSWTGQLDWTVGLENWNGQLNWTIGLDFEWDFFH